MPRQSCCSSPSEGGTSRLETDGDRLLLRCDASGVNKPPVAVDAVVLSRDAVAAAPAAFRFRDLDSVDASSSVVLRAVIEPGGGRSSIYA